MTENSSTSTSHDLTGKDLGDYHTLRRLGSGGMAEVYLAEQRSLGRQVALKVLHRHFVNDVSYVERFQNEARAAASLVHSNIVQIYDVGQADGLHFIAQEYVRGKNLAELMQRQGSLDPRLVLDVMRQVVAALGKAAELGIVHRDIKPENIMLSQSGEVKVADFGLARLQDSDVKTLTQVGVTMGTPLYMSPEQIEGRSLDSRSDIYSLGITCYHLLAGVPPHSGETALAIAVQHLNNPPKPLENARPEVPFGLARIIHQMISKQPEQRHANPNELLVKLRELASSGAEEGWADGPDDWSLAEWVALQQSRSEATAQLDELMKTSTHLTPTRSRLSRLAWLLVPAVLIGIILSRAIQPRFLLAGPRTAQVETRGSAWAQLYHAKMTNSEAAWMAVWENFPNDDTYYHTLAKQGLVRYYLNVSQDYTSALRHLRDLEEVSTTNEPLQAFTQAGLCIAHQRLRQLPQARDALTRLTSDMKDQLRSTDPQMDRLLQTALRELGE